MLQPSSSRGRALGAGVVLVVLGALVPVALAEPAAEASHRPPVTSSASAGASASASPTASASGTPSPSSSSSSATPSATGSISDSATASPSDSSSDSPSDSSSDGGVDPLGGVLGGGLLDAQQQATQDADPGEQENHIVLSPQLQADAGPLTSYPGLPPLSEFGQWDGAAASQLTEVLPSEQYLQVPSFALAADVSIDVLDTPPDGYLFAYQPNIAGYVISPPGADHQYGELSPFRARLLAFGALPVEATVHLAQVRDADDLPVGLKVGQLSLSDTRGFTKLQDAALTGSLTVRLSDVTVDQVPVDVGPSCRASSPATLNVVGRGYWQGNDQNWTLDSDVPTPETLITPDQVANDFYTLPYGGLLTGTIDIPSFTGCTGASGDLSRLISNAVSSPVTPLKVRQSGTGYCFPPEVATACPVPDLFPYPSPPAA